MILQNAKKLLRIYSLFFLVILCGAMAFAQQPQPTKEKESNFVDFTGFKGKIFELKNRDPRDLVTIIAPLGSGFKGATIQANSEMKTLTVRDFPENIAVIEEALKRLDVPAPPQAKRNIEPNSNIELHLQVLLAHNAIGETDVAVQELDSVIKQLKNTFHYKTYSLLSSIMQRSSSSIMSRGVISAAPPLVERAADASYELVVQSFTTNFYSEQSPILMLRNFRFVIADPFKVFGNAEIMSDVTIKEGEKVVVGTATIKDKALILVLSVRIIK